MTTWDISSTTWDISPNVRQEFAPPEKDCVPDCRFTGQILKVLKSVTHHLRILQGIFTSEPKGSGFVKLLPLVANIQGLLIKKSFLWIPRLYPAAGFDNLLLMQEQILWQVMLLDQWVVGGACWESDTISTSSRLLLIRRFDWGEEADQWIWSRSQLWSIGTSYGTPGAPGQVK